MLTWMDTSMSTVTVLVIIVVAYFTIRGAVTDGIVTAYKKIKEEEENSYAKEKQQNSE